jgi:hypothetical protein
MEELTTYGRGIEDVPDHRLTVTFESLSGPRKTFVCHIEARNLRSDEDFEALILSVQKARKSFGLLRSEEGAPV